MRIQSENMTSWDEIKDRVYGKRGCQRRDQLEEESLRFIARLRAMQNSSK